MSNLYVYKVPAVGTPAGGQGGCIDSNACISFHFVPKAGTTPAHFEYDNGAWPVADRDSCSDTPDRVGVTVVATFKFIFNFGGWADVTLAPTSVLQLEPTSCNG